MSWTDEQLSAFLDNELPPAAAEAIAVDLETQPALAARLERLALAQTAFQTALSDIDARPLPAAVTALLATPPTTAEAPIPSPNVLPFRPRRIVAFIEEHRAMAAGLVCAAGFGLLTLGGGREAPDASMLAMGKVAPALALALNDTPSAETRMITGAAITPHMSFISADGMICRQFDADADTQSASSVACRDETGWQIRMTVFGPRAAPSGDYQTASGARRAAIDAYIDTQISGDPLSVAEETDAISRDWAAPRQDR